MVVVSLLVLGTATATIQLAAAPLLLHAYSHRFSFIPGLWFGEHIAALAKDPEHSCAIIGQSNSREAFDPQLFDRAAPGTRFINAATTGGNNEVFEVQADILRHYQLHPRCVIIGVTLWTMYRDGSPPLAGGEYLGLLGWGDLLGLASHPLATREGPRIFAEQMLPLRTVALQLNRVLRAAVRDERAHLVSALPPSRYEGYPGELEPAGDYYYLNTPPQLSGHWAELVRQRRPWYASSRYGGPTQTRSMRNTLDELLSLTPHVFVVLTPQTAILDPASRQGAPYMRRVLANYAGRITTIDCSQLRNTRLFVDDGHLDGEGRAIFSQQVSAIIAAVLSGRTPPVEPNCAVGAL
jgi:hypothetical protein